MPIIEGTDTGAGHVQLIGVDTAGVAGNLAEFPAFSVEISVAIDAANGAIRIDDLVAHVVAHQIEAKAGDLVIAGPDLQRVDHQLGHHAMFAGSVLAAGRGFHRAGSRVAAVVVARYDLVQNGFFGQAGSVGVVVDHVHHGNEAIVGERLHHLAELDDALHAFGVAGVAALGRGEVEGVVAPVEVIQAAQVVVQRLRLAAGGVEAL